mgnify:CR=1 FL=1
MGNLEVESKILTLFRENVKGRNLSAMGAATKHDGAAGHRLETLFGIKHNGDNAPDLLGYELKSDTKSKTTFGTKRRASPAAIINPYVMGLAL